MNNFPVKLRPNMKRGLLDWMSEEHKINKESWECDWPVCGFPGKSLKCQVQVMDNLIPGFRFWNWMN